MDEHLLDRASHFVVAIAAIILVVVGWSSAAGLDILWDEDVDLAIAKGLLSDPLRGERPTLDPSQMRLPMYANAAAFFFSGDADLKTARFVSLLCGAATIFAAAALARLLFGAVAAMLTAVLLACSPYFISFTRIAMTEGDIFPACFVTVAIWTFVRYLRRPTNAAWAAAAIALAFAVGAKFFAGYLVIVFALLTLSTRSPHRHLARPLHECRRRFQTALALQIGLLVTTASLAMLHRNPPHNETLAAWAEHFGTAATCGWIITLVVWLYTLIQVLGHGGLAPRPFGRFIELAVFAAIAFFVLMPAHLLEHTILRELAARTLTWDGSVPLALWSDHLRLYSGIILIKSTLPIGIISVIAMIYAGIRERDDGRWRPLILSIVFFLIALCLLPLRQTFYLMAVYPLIAITTAAAIVLVSRFCLKQGARKAVLWAMLVIACFAYLIRETARIHPYYNLYGTALIGDTWLGNEARGYRNLIQTPSDGVESLIRWCNDSPLIQPGDRSISYLWEQRIIDATLRKSPPFHFIPRGVNTDSDAVPPQPDLTKADFVLLHINNRLGYGDRPPDCPPQELLNAQFEVVYTIHRGPLEVAWAYARRR